MLGLDATLESHMNDVVSGSQFVMASTIPVQELAVCGTVKGKPSSLAASIIMSGQAVRIGSRSRNYQHGVHCIQGWQDSIEPPNDQKVRQRSEIFRRDRLNQSNRFVTQAPPWLRS
jgi:hypothetical protein